MTLCAYIPSVLSSLFRIAAYVFLRIIPTRLANPTLPVLYLLHLWSLYQASPPPKPREPAEQKKPNADPDPKQDQSFPLSLALSLPTSSKWVQLSIILVNTLLLLASADLALSPFYDEAHDVTFTRVGAVAPDHAKIMVRYPQDNATENTLFLLYRESGSEKWLQGPKVHLTAQSDWVSTTALTNLWPETTYQYMLADTNKTILPYPATPNHFTTFPDPRLHAGTHFSFLSTSCLTPNFPYEGPAHRRTIKGFDLLNSYLASSSEDVQPDDAHNSIPFPAFLLFLGDFIYADVPIYIGDDQEAYRRMYRRNYASPSFRKIYEKIPILHAYDDHEFINNYAGEGLDVAPFTNASNAYTIYSGAANPSSTEDGAQYYNFQYGDSAFFVLDTRRYRSPVETTQPSHRTMLGEHQLAELHQWLHKVNQTSTFKFIVTSVPFTALWTYDAQVDSWAAYPTEKAALLDLFHTVPNLVLLSGDRHEFAIIEFNSPNPNHHIVREISTSPLNMFYIPFVHTLQSHSDAHFVTNDTSGNVLQIPYERTAAYIPNGNSKWASFEIDTRNQSAPSLKLEVVINGRVQYKLGIDGIAVRNPALQSIGAYVAHNMKDLFGKIGLTSGRWF